MKRNDLPDLKYSIPEGVKSLPGEHPLLSTPQNGRIALDRRLMDLWAAANASSLMEMVQSYSNQGTSAGMVMAALACLAEAGLLSRSRIASRPKSRAVKGKLVSVVIVAYKGEEWLKECLAFPSKADVFPA